MMIFALTLLAALAAEPVPAGGTLVQGTILGVDGEPLPVQHTGREVLPGASLSGCGATYNALRLDGSFSFAVPEGGCQLVVSAPGYRSQTLSLSANSEPVDITLQPSAVAPPAAPGIVVHRRSSSRSATPSATVVQVAPTAPAAANPAALQQLDPAALQQMDPAALSALMEQLGEGGDASALSSMLGGGMDNGNLAALLSQLQSGDVDPAMLDRLSGGDVLSGHPGAAAAEGHELPDLQTILEGLQKLQDAVK